jgi:diacylglycerol kinase family enzyme
MTARRYLLVGNPTAQSGKNRERITRAKAMLEQHGNAVALFDTLPDGRTIAALRDHLDADPPHAVIAMGGDGTFREVGAALFASRHRQEVALAMLPTGTANDQGKSFGLDAGEAGLARNCEVILAGHETKLDAGLIAGLSPDGVTRWNSVFFDSAGFGLCARVLLERNRDREVVAGLGPLSHLYRDHAVYAGAFLRVFMGSFIHDQRFDVELSVDGKVTELKGLTDLVVKNTRIYAGAWVLDDSAQPDDGVFEVVPFFDQADWITKAIIDHEGHPLPRALRDPASRGRIGIQFGKHIHITFQNPLPLAQLDGEEADPFSAVRIEVVQQAIRLVVPKDA